MTRVLKSFHVFFIKLACLVGAHGWTRLNIVTANDDDYHHHTCIHCGKLHFRKH